MGINKKCTNCLQTKSIAYFYKQKCGLLGRTGECKDCRRLRSRKWNLENKEKKSETAKRWHQINKINRKEYNEKWRKNNPEYFREYYKQNREIRLSCNKRFWLNHPERYELYKIYRAALYHKKINKLDQCQICGSKEKKIHGHHFDYAKPLEVTWLCVECHKEIHRKKRFT
jgi:hypothetical protein